MLVFDFFFVPNANGLPENVRQKYELARTSYRVISFSVTVIGALLKFAENVKQSTKYVM